MFNLSFIPRSCTWLFSYVLETADTCCFPVKIQPDSVRKLNFCLVHEIAKIQNVAAVFEIAVLFYLFCTAIMLI